MLRKQHLILRFLKENAFDNKYYSIKEILFKNEIPISEYEAHSIGKILKQKGFIKLVASKDCVEASITASGIEYIEDINKKHKYLNNQNIASNVEKSKIIEGINELIERIKKLEKGQEIIYDGIFEELEEIKELIQKIPKKNIKNQIVGILVEYGFGKISDEFIDVISSSDRFLE